MQLSTGQSGRVLVSGAKVGTGVAIGGAGIGYGLTELGKPITGITEPIDSLVRFFRRGFYNDYWYYYISSNHTITR